VRIAGGGSRGRIEALYGGKWGAVCGDSWDDADATVACRQLGYENGIISYAHHTPVGGQEDIEIVANSVNCSGAEASLLNCSARWGSTHCADLSE